MSLNNKIEKTDLARDALYEKVNTIAEELDDAKVSKSGDVITGNLELENGSIYLENIGGSVGNSKSKLVLGTPDNEIAFLTGNSSGAFGIYSEKSGIRKGITCYPASTFFADATTKTIDLGRNNNVWKVAYINKISDGTNIAATADIISGITNAQTEITNIKEQLENVGGGSGRNVGDIFYTTRTDTELNGAVECNGGTYNIGDFEGNQSIGNLLNAGSLPYVSLAEYRDLVIENGSCRAFGWDGGTSFRVPWLNDVYIEAGTATSADEFISESLPNITGELVEFVHGKESHTSSGAFETTFTGSGNIGSGTGISYNSTTFDASRVSSTYQDGAKVKPDSVRYRAMVQLANEATDEAVITATSALQQISEIVPTITYWE